MVENLRMTLSNATTGIPDRVYESQGYKRYIFPYVKNDNVLFQIGGYRGKCQQPEDIQLNLLLDVCSGCGGGDADRWTW